MLSAHYTAVSSPAHPQSQHTPLLSSYPHHHQAISSLLPTPPSSPPTIGMHPVESTISLLESLVAFYHQERMWVYRTRAQLEMGLLHHVPTCQLDTSVSVEAELHDDPDSPGQQASSSPDSVKTADNSSPSPPTKWLKRKKAFNLRLEGISSTRGMLPAVARGGISKHPHPHTQHRARQSSNLNPASVPASSHQSAMHGSTPAALQPHPSASMASSNTTVSFYPPTAMNTATTLTSPYLSHPSFQLPTTTNQQPLTPAVPTSRYVPTPTHHAHTTTVQPSQAHSTHAGPLVLGAGGREPTVQILEMFERMMQARMESCERVTRMVREANKPGGICAGGTGAVGVSPGSIGGPVGGFGGPVGLPVGVGPQEIAGSYSHVQGTAQVGDPEMMTTQTPTEQGFLG